MGFKHIRLSVIFIATLCVSFAHGQDDVLRYKQGKFHYDGHTMKIDQLDEEYELYDMEKITFLKLKNYNESYQKSKDAMAISAVIGVFSGYGLYHYTHKDNGTLTDGFTALMAGFGIVGSITSLVVSSSIASVKLKKRQKAINELLEIFNAPKDEDVGYQIQLSTTANGIGLTLNF